jgi:hypothetical protein
VLVFCCHHSLGEFSTGKLALNTDIFLLGRFVQDIVHGLITDHDILYTISGHEDLNAQKHGSSKLSFNSGIHAFEMNFL